jgi:hypothetical protein
MSIQNKTGNLTENLVKVEINKLGLNVIKPVPDRGVDLIVSSNQKPLKTLKIQVKGRGKIQTNNRYRWFQIRSTKKQREETIEEGLEVSEAWRKKVSKVDIFIFVSEKENEFWIFEPKDIENLISINRSKYGKRKDNIKGLQAEIDLDIEDGGIQLTEIYKRNLNSWDLITKYFI